MSDFSLTKFFRNQYLSEGDIKLRPYDLRNHPDVKILADTIGKMLNVKVDADLGSGSYNGREGYYIKMPRYTFQYWDDETKAIAKAALDKASELSKEFDFEFNDVSDYDIEPGERDWPANIGFFIKEKESIEENLKNYIKVSEPSFRKDKNNPNFLSAYIKYDTGGGGALMAFGQETMSGQIRRLSSAEALRQMEIIAGKLKDNFNIEDIEVTDLENGVIELFAVSDDFIDMDPKSELSMALLNEMDMNDPVLVKSRAAKMAADKLAKMRADNAGDDGNDKFFDNAKKIAFLKKEREQLMRDMEQEAEPEGGPIADEYGDKLNKIDAAIAKLSGRKEMTYDQAISMNEEFKIGDKVTFKSGGDDMEIIDVRDMFASDLKAYRVKNADGETFEYSEDQLQLAEGESKMPTQDQVDKFFALTQNETHYLNSKPVAGQEATFNLMKIEPWDEYDLSNWNSLVRKAKQQGKLDESASTEEKRIAMRAIKSIAKYRGVSEDEARNDLMRAAKELGSLKEAIKDIKETIELGKNLTEELCAAGKAYRKRRMAAGEKSSAYLSGRAVKVCKGQMSGKKKKK